MTTRTSSRTLVGILVCTLSATAPDSLFAQAPQCAYGDRVPPNEEPSASVRAELTNVREAVWRAYFTGDSAALVKLLPERMSAMPQERREIIRDAQMYVRDGGKFVSIDFADDRFFVDGNVAIVWSRYAVHLRDAADVARRQEGCAMELFTRKGDRWINPYWHLDTK